MKIRQDIWELFIKRIRPFQIQQFSTDKKIGNSSNASSRENGSMSKEVDKVNGSSSMSRHGAYKQLENLDFMTAAKIMFTTPPKKKKFGPSCKYEFCWLCLGGSVEHHRTNSARNGYMHGNTKKV